MNESDAIARPGQTLETHLHECAAIASADASRIGLPSIGRLIGLLHDLGKFSKVFQSYIGGHAKSGGNHSSAGGLWALAHFPESANFSELAFRQIVALCCFSHHAGTLIDCAPPDASRPSVFSRIREEELKTHFNEVSERIPPKLRNEISETMESAAFESELREFRERLKNFAAREGAKNRRRTKKLFALGSAARFLLSCLIDADHTSAAGEAVSAPPPSVPDWGRVEASVERFISGFRNDSKISALRAEISERCREAGTRRSKGIALLTLPTGSGKTLASLRYAVAHAKAHRAERIFYVIPYTSILSQNADVIRRAVGKDFAASVLEHHSNVVPESDVDAYRKQTESWNAPIVLTTAVQFLNALYAKGADCVRRMNKLGNAVVVFDEIQALPTSSVYLFNGALNFLCDFCGASALLCTATQPLLDRVPDGFWALSLREDPHVIPDYARYFPSFEQNRKILACDVPESERWDLDAFAEFLLKTTRERGHTLAVVNTKPFAAALFKRARERADDDVETFHLSNSMCSAHRAHVIEKHISRKALADATRRGKKVLCVSTQVVECGVDVDFNAVVRSIAGADSLAQAFGRCNRDGALKDGGRAFIVHPTKTLENADAIPQIAEGKRKAAQTIRELSAEKCLGEDFLNRYFSLYFTRFADELYYPMNDGLDACALLTDNAAAADAFREDIGRERFPLPQAFDTTASGYSPISEKTVSVLVPYTGTPDGRGNGNAREEEPPDEQKTGAELLAALQDLRDPQTPDEWKRAKKLLRLAQKFTVAVHEKKIGGEAGARFFMLNRGAVEFYSLSPEFYDSAPAAVGLAPELAGTLIL